MKYQHKENLLRIFSFINLGKTKIEKDKNMSKNIWILEHYAVSPDMPGGTRQYDLAKELAKKGYTITIFASGFDHDTKRHIKCMPKEKFRIKEYNGVNFVWLNTCSYYANNWRRLLNMISYGVNVIKINHKFEKPNVIIGSSPHPFAVLAAWWLAKRYKAKFIFEVRDLWPQTAIDMGVIKANSIPARLLYVWEKFMYKRAEKIIVLMPYAKEYINKRGIDSKKLVWIPNGVDLEKFDCPEPFDPSSEMVRTFIEQKDKFIIIYCGAHGPANGLDIAIKAVCLATEKSANIHLFLIGNGSEKRSLIKKVKRENICNVTFLDPIAKSQIANVLKYSDLLLHCLKPMNILKYGLSSNKVFDYLASGKPTIVSTNINNNFIQESDIYFPIEAGNVKSLAETILKVQKMTSQERKYFGANGRHYVEKYHSSKVLAEKLEKIL